MTAETDEKLTGKLDELRAAAEREDASGAFDALAGWLEQHRTEVYGMLTHQDSLVHNLLQLVSEMHSELEAFRPLLRQLRPGGTTQPDWISVGQTVRQARRAARRTGNGNGT